MTDTLASVIGLSTLAAMILTAFGIYFRIEGEIVKRFKIDEHIEELLLQTGLYLEESGVPDVLITLVIIVLSITIFALLLLVAVGGILLLYNGLETMVVYLLEVLIKYKHDLGK